MGGKFDHRTRRPKVLLRQWLSKYSNTNIFVVKYKIYFLICLKYQIRVAYVKYIGLRFK